MPSDKEHVPQPRRNNQTISPRRAVSGALLAACLLFAGTAPVAATDPDSPPIDAEREAPYVIEVSDPSIDVTSVESQHEIATMLATAEANRTHQSGNEAGLLAAAVTGQISVNFVDNPPSDVKAVVNAAIADWNAVLIIPAGAPIVIDFHWQTLDPGYLGWARPTHIERMPGTLPTSDYYPVALANALLGYDLRPSEAEIEIGLASNLYNVANGWYAGAGSVPSNRRDVYSTMLHEIGHGLGFIGTAQQASGQLPSLDTIPIVYDRLARFNGSAIVNVGNVSTALTSNNLYLNIGGERLRRIYAPGSFQNGSSFSHFDESYSPGEAGSMMSPALGLGQADRSIDAAILGVMVGIGWNVSAPTLTPTISNVSPTTNSLTANWSIDLSQKGLPPVSYVLQAKQGATTAGSTTLSWTALSGAVGGLTSFEDFELTLDAVAANGARASDTFQTSGDPYLLKAEGSGLTRTLSWKPMTSTGSNGATYTVQRSKDGGPFITVGSTTSTGLVDSSLTPGVFQYRVTGSSAGGSSAEARSLFVGATTTTVRPFSLDGQVARLYNAYFDRIPDASGMGYWLGERSGGLSLEAMSASFAGGAEFTAKYGSLSNGDFVNLVYDEVIGRPADPEGFNYWLTQLNNGMSRGAMMIGFSEAAEYITLTATVGPQTSVEAAVFRLYVAYFLRAPDSAGFNYWTSQANAGQSIEAISAQFAASAEFVNRYGSVDNAQFVTLVYQNVLTREPEGSGQAYWTAQLNAGASRGNVMVGFSNSAEFLLATGTLP